MVIVTVMSTMIKVTLKVVQMVFWFLFVKKEKAKY